MPRLFLIAVIVFPATMPPSFCAAQQPSARPPAIRVPPAPAAEEASPTEGPLPPLPGAEPALPADMPPLSPPESVPVPAAIAPHMQPSRTHYFASPDNQRRSIWHRRDPSKVFVCYDTQARTIGDLITIVIRESTDVDNSDSRELKKASTDNGSLEVDTSTGGDFGSSAANLKGTGKATSNRQFDGKSKFSSAREFTDRVTVTVQQVLPNGNLVVAGGRRIGVAGDQRFLKVTGIVRPIDVSVDNTIESNLVGSLVVTYEGDGAETRFTNQGWLSRITNYVWPF